MTSSAILSNRFSSAVITSWTSISGAEAPAVTPITVVRHGRIHGEASAVDADQNRVAATVISHHYLGNLPAFEIPKHSLESPYELLAFVLLGLLAELVELGADAEHDQEEHEQVVALVLEHREQMSDRQRGDQEPEPELADPRCPLRARDAPEQRHDPDRGADVEEGEKVVLCESIAVYQEENPLATPKTIVELAGTLRISSSPSLSSADL